MSLKIARSRTLAVWPIERDGVKIGSICKANGPTMRQFPWVLRVNGVLWSSDGKPGARSGFAAIHCGSIAKALAQAERALAAKEAR